MRSRRTSRGSKSTSPGSQQQLEAMSGTQEMASAAVRIAASGLPVSAYPTAAPAAVQAASTAAYSAGAGRARIRGRSVSKSFVMRQNQPTSREVSVKTSLATARPQAEQSVDRSLGCRQRAHPPGIGRPTSSRRTEMPRSPSATAERVYVACTAVGSRGALPTQDRSLHLSTLERLGAAGAGAPVVR
jgi:hypothetical protein